MICPRWTTPTGTTAAKTATTSETTASPEGLVRCNLFLLQEDGHAATRCPDYNDSLPFLQPGWQKEMTPGGFIMIPPWVTIDRR